MWKLKSFEEDIDNGGYADCIQVFLKVENLEVGPLIQVYAIQSISKIDGETE